MSTNAPQKNMQTLTAGQLQDLSGILKKPISGREVMIPLTSKAFVIGALRPNKDSNGEEQVLVRDGQSAELKEMSRASACALLEEQKAKKKPAKIKGKGSLQSALKPSKKKPDDPSKNASPTDNTPNSGTQPLSYFDIKEEIDGSGTVVKSEAVNVTKQLDLVSKQLGESKEGESEDNTAEYKEQMDLEDDSDYQEIPVDEADNRPPVSDQEYESLSARLEELARLEEEAEKKAQDNKLSSRDLISKGWSKGFLSGKNKAPAVKAQPEATTKSDSKSTHIGTDIPEAKKQAAKTKGKESKGWSKGFFNKPNKNSTKTPTSTLLSEGSDEANSRKVSFQESPPDVREIPRIGEKSATLLKNPPPPSHASHTNTRSATANPFDSSVVSDVVKEHHVGTTKANTSGASGTSEPKKKLSKFALERQQASNDSSEQPKKRLSKFAQERQQIR